MEPAERWVSCSRHDRYEVSDAGRVRNRLTSHVLTPLLQVKVAGDGPGYLKVHLGRCQRDVFIHQLVTEAFYGLRPVGMTVDHRNNNCIDNRAVNLRWLRAHENYARHRPEPDLQDYIPMTEEEDRAIRDILITAGW